MTDKVIEARSDQRDSQDITTKKKTPYTAEQATEVIDRWCAGKSVIEIADSFREAVRLLNTNRDVDRARAELVVNEIREICLLLFNDRGEDIHPNNQLAMIRNVLCQHER